MFPPVESDLLVPEAHLSVLRQRWWVVAGAPRGFIHPIDRLDSHACDTIAQDRSRVHSSGTAIQGRDGKQSINCFQINVHSGHQEFNPIKALQDTPCGMDHKILRLKEQ